MYCCCRCHQHVHLDEIFFHHISMNTTCWQIVDKNAKHVKWNASKVHVFISREKRGVRSPSLMFLYTCVPTRSFYDILLWYLFLSRTNYASGSSWRRMSSQTSLETPRVHKVNECKPHYPPPHPNVIHPWRDPFCFENYKKFTSS